MAPLHGAREREQAAVVERTAHKLHRHGQPAMLMEMVNMSDRYICVGSDSSPNLKAAVGLAGMRITSTFS